MTQEIDDLAQLCLRFVDPRNVCKRDTVARRLVTTCARAAERAENVLNVARAPHQPEQQDEKADRWPETEQQVLPPRRPGIQRLGVHDDSLLLEQARQRVVVGERGNLRLEPRRWLRARITQLFREGALDRRALRRDRLDVSGCHLLEEERAVRNADPRGRLRSARTEVEVEDEKGDEEEEPAAASAQPRRQLRRRR